MIKSNTEGKSTKHVGTRIILVITTIILLLTIIRISSALFNSYPEINPGTDTIYTDQELSCRWTINETTTVNVTWYRNGIINNTYNRSCTENTPCSTEDTGLINKNATTKNDVWTCAVTYYNGTEYETRNDTITIQDSTPNLPEIYYSNFSPIYNNTLVVIPEDNTTILYSNSTDADNDVIIYTIESNSASCSIGSSTGVITCNPSSESSIGLHQLQVLAKQTSGATNGYVNISINVTQNNDPPYFSPSLINKTVIQDNGLNYLISGDDAESNTPYNFSITTTLSSLIIEYVSATSARIKFNNSGQDISLFSDRGNHTVNVFINDSGSPSRTFNRSFILEVIPINELPNLTVYVENSNNLSQGGSLIIRVNATDENNDTLTFYSSNTDLYAINYSVTNKTDPNGISFANATINIPLLTNNHVISRNITITAFDGKENISQQVNLGIINVNDAPVIHEISNYSTNTLNNRNLSNLTAYTGVLFSYRVNATDIDTSTYEGETLTYTNNDSATFPIDPSTGIILFTPQNSGNYTFIITVTDIDGATYNITAGMSIYPNDNPTFTQNNISIQCYEYDEHNYPNNCYYNISSNVTDSDLGDYVSSFITNSTLFTIGVSNGIINFTANQTDIGTYEVLLNITDTRGGMNYTTVYLTINNTNNHPVVNDTITIPPGRMVIGNVYEISVYAGDSDFQISNSYENLTFRQNATGPNPGIFTITKTSTTEAAVSFNPVTTTDAGAYTINITVVDFYNNVSDPELISIFIYNSTDAPIISQVTPYGTPLVSNSVNTSWINTTNIPEMSTNITIAENSTYVFNQTTIIDNISYSNIVNYSWSYDGTTVSTNTYYSRNFDFFSSGIHNVTVSVIDEFNNSASFRWIINVTNINRLPLLINPLENLTGDYAVNRSTNYGGYMSRHGNPLTNKFYDPDDDLDSNLSVDGNENITLTYSATSCSNANFVFIGATLRVETISIGTCTVNFTAIDLLNNSMNVTAYNVLVNVTAISNDTTPEPQPISSSGGGGSNTVTITIPWPEEVEKPKPLQILTPKLVTVYKNATVKVPIVLNNTWNDTLEGVRLGAYTNASNVTLYLDKGYFQRIPVGGVEEVTLTIGNYKSEGHYEIQLYANVSNPTYQDIATIFVNSADMKSEGEELDSMISFAQDLLSSNPECQELTELLTEAKRELSQDNYVVTAKLVDTVINGCKYLVTNSKNVERPGNGFVKTFEWNSKYNQYVIIGAFFILFLGAAYYLFKKNHEDKEF